MTKEEIREVIVKTFKEVGFVPSLDTKKRQAAARATKEFLFSIGLDEKTPDIESKYEEVYKTLYNLAGKFLTQNKKSL